MKKLLLPIIFFVVCVESRAQNEIKIEASKLIKITETSDFSGLVKLVKDLSYQVMDSSKEANGSLIYISREKKINGNMLGCTVTSKNKINQLSFSTYNSTTSDNLKKQIKDLGFKSSGVNKKPLGEIIETQDFEKGKMLIGVGAKKKPDNRIEYEFTFMMW